MAQVRTSHAVDPNEVIHSYMRTRMMVMEKRGRAGHEVEHNVRH